MQRRARRALFERLRAANPEPVSELQYATPFELLVAVMLSAQATDRSVNAATAKLFPVANTPQALLALGADGVKPYLKTVGLYNAKTANLIAPVSAADGSAWRTGAADRESLEALPGVGRKTANVVLNIAFGETTIAVDTHIFRVANRTGLAPGPTPWPWKWSWSGPRRRNLRARPITGCCCTAAMCVSPAPRNARAA